MDLVRIGIIGDRSYNKHENYYRAVEAAGAEPVAISFYDHEFDLTGIDGIIIPGGCDVDPAFYGQYSNGSVDTNPKLDLFEFEVINRAVDLNIPILGVCRGMQILNVYFGGTLTQDLQNSKRHMQIQGKDSIHCNKVPKDSFLHDIYDKDEIVTNSAHHQAVDKIADCLKPSLYSESGVIEAFENKNKEGKVRIYGVQFHPERMCLKYANDKTETGLNIFNYFVEQLKKTKAGGL